MCCFQIDANAALVAVLTQSKDEAPNTASADVGADFNLCNPDRTINIITTYMLHHLSIPIEEVLANYIFDPAKTFEYPHNYDNVRNPDNLADFPNLEQAFWTIIEQYNNNTISQMSNRNNRKIPWCRAITYSSYIHCKKHSESLNCGNKDTFCQIDMSNYLYELCIRLMKVTDDEVDEHAK